MPPRRTSPLAFWRALHRIADRNLGDFERALVAEIEANDAAIDPVELRAALDAAWTAIEVARDSGHAALPADAANRVLAALGITDRLPRKLTARYSALMHRTLAQAGAATATQLPAGLAFRFDRTNPQAIKWARKRAGELVAEVTTATRRAIRREIVRGFVEQRTVPDTARAIRSVIGLTEKQAARARAFQSAGLPAMNDRVAEGLDLLATQKARLKSLRSRFPTAAKPFDADEIATIADRYRARILRQRAEAIAQTETIRAAAGGQVETWRQAGGKGLINITESRKIWIYTKDSRTDCSCRSIPELNPRGVGLDEPFKMRDCATGAIRLVYLPGDTHPRCRCALGMKYADDV